MDFNWINASGNAAVLLGLIVAWFTLRKYVRDEITAMEESIIKKLSREENEILSGQDDRCKSYCDRVDTLEQSIEDINKTHLQYEKRVDKRYAEAKSENDCEHGDMKRVLKLLVRQGSVVLDILEPMANGHKETLKKVKEDMNNELTERI